MCSSSMADDDAPMHIWRLSQVFVQADGAYTEYSCELCLDALLVAPGGVRPEEA